MRAWAPPPRPAPHAGLDPRGFIPDPWVYDLSQRQALNLNRLNHPGACFVALVKRYCFFNFSFQLFVVCRNKADFCMLTLNPSLFLICMTLVVDFFPRCLLSGWGSSFLFLVCWEFIINVCCSLSNVFYFHLLRWSHVYCQYGELHWFFKS